MRSFVLLAFAFVCSLIASGASAQVDPAREGLTTSGLCGLTFTGFPTCPTRVGFGANAGYGYTEEVGPLPGAHYRLAGALGLGVVPLANLAIALRFDGRVDLHPPDEFGRDHTGVGEPRLFVRGGHDLGRLSLGGELVVWVPGSDAPSLEPRATTVDLKALAAYRARRPIAVLGHVGMRLDQSERTTPDLSRVRPGDRISLNISDSHAVLVAIGVSTRAFAHSELFGELALDLLVGPKAPRFIESPFRAVVGARRFFSRRLQGELSASVTLSARPDVGPTRPLVPIEPRFMMQVGLRYGIPLFEPPPPPPPIEVPPPKTTTTVTGVLVDPNGGPLPDVQVMLMQDAAPQREDVTDGDGRYRFEDVPFGPTTLEAHAPGFASERWRIEVGPELAAPLPRPLAAKGNLGTLRVLARTFASEPIAASILIRDQSGQRVGDGKANADGLFEFSLPPGRYVVMISSPGFRPHRREVLIERFSVAILNVDMRESR